MSHEPTIGASDEWYTPAYIFDALGVTFDLDVASPPRSTHVPAHAIITADSLAQQWNGFVWMNPPFGGRNGLAPWVEKWIEHGDGIALTPDRSSTAWWQRAASASDALLQVHGKVKFERPDGTYGAQPTNGTTLFAIGPRGVSALVRASAHGLGWCSARGAA